MVPGEPDKAGDSSASGVEDRFLKFDPLLQADYYRLQAFFANVRAKDDIVLASREAAERHRRQLAHL